jgi:4-amino-4-deoxy-L-arabinose transferase-like glycosyltransferase
MRWCRCLLRLLPVSVPLLVLILTGLRGVDFGKHWDEDETNVGPMQQMIKSQTLLPAYYQYPSFNYWVCVAGILPEIIKEFPSEALYEEDEDSSSEGDTDADNNEEKKDATPDGNGPKTMDAAKVGETATPDDQEDYLVPQAVESQAFLQYKERLAKFVFGDAYRLRMRGIFLILSSLTVLWVYLLVLAWRHSWIEALLASSFLAFSWEIAYHFRYLATDGVLVQFGALTMLGVVFSWLKGGSRNWLRLAAVAAGLGCGSKYPGGLLLAPVLVAGYLAWDRQTPRRALLRLWFELGVIFAGAYLLSTPGTILQPLKFHHDVQYIRNHYAGSGDDHGGHSLPPGFVHGVGILEYLSLALFSPYSGIALLVFGLALLGGYALIREEPKTALVFLIFPVLYLPYFSTQGVQIVRNYLVAAPYLAILAARGAAFVWQKLASQELPALGNGGRRRLSYLRTGFALTLLACQLINAGWLVWAAETIAHRDLEERPNDRFLREAATYISAHPEQRYYLSRQVRQRLAALGSLDFPNLVADPQQADAVIFYTDEGAQHEGKEVWEVKLAWPATKRTLTTTWFGPYEVNFNYYPSWEGDERIIVMSLATAREIGIAQNLKNEGRKEEEKDL